jgi:hypothetical protein
MGKGLSPDSYRDLSPKGNVRLVAGSESPAPIFIGVPQK